MKEERDKSREEMVERKKRIRQEYLRRRNALSRGEIWHRSQKIKERLFGMPEFSEARTIMFYASVGSEVDTEVMIKEALRLGKRIGLPAVRADQLEAYEIKDWEKEVSPGTFGVREPNRETCGRLNNRDINLVIVPGVAFDRKGARLGYGRGYYDRFLAVNFLQTSGFHPPIIALAFDLQICEEIPFAPGDVRVEKIITETSCINCLRENGTFSDCRDRR